MILLHHSMVGNFYIYYIPIILYYIFGMISNFEEFDEEFDDVYYEVAGGCSCSGKRLTIGQNKAGGRES